MADLYVISGAAGMTGNELVRQLLKRGHYIIGFDNFFASSIKTLEDVIASDYFSFHEFDLNNDEQMNVLENEIKCNRKEYEKLIYVNCAAVVHTEHFYHIAESS